MADDPYSILGVEQGATGSEVRAAYRRLAALYHPDRNPGFQEAANEKLKTLNDAYNRIKAFGSSRPVDASEPRPSQPETEQEHQSTKHDRSEADRNSSAPPNADQGISGEESTGTGLDHRAAIAIELARVGILKDVDRDHPVVEVVASVVPAGATVFLCVPYSAVVASGQYEFREAHLSVMRIAQPAEASTALPLLPGLGRVMRTGIVLCTADAMVWMTWRAVPADFAWEQVTVKACSVVFTDILGSKVTSRRKGTVDVWIDNGPTLTFRAAPSDAEALSEYVDREALSQ